MNTYNPYAILATLTSIGCLSSNFKLWKWHDQTYLYKPIIEATDIISSLKFITELTATTLLYPDRVGEQRFIYVQPHKCHRVTPLCSASNWISYKEWTRLKFKHTYTNPRNQPWRLTLETYPAIQTLETNPDKQSYPKSDPWPLTYMALSVLYRRSIKPLPTQYKCNNNRHPWKG